MVQRPSLDLFEAIHSARSLRYLKPDPIPMGIIRELLNAAIRGPSGGNSQTWRWLVITDSDTKRQIAEWYREGWQRSYGRSREEQLARSAEEGGLGRANYLAAEHLANHLEEAPVWIMPVLPGAAARPNSRAGASIYGAVQNLVLAARAFGIGSTLTSLYSAHEDDVKRLLGIPDDALTMALIPLGYPARGTWGEPRRRPVEEVAFSERWGEPFP
jgi:nitroreductase